MDNKPRKLDRIDREILFWMDLNSRSSFPFLSRKIHASPATIRYRLSQLVKSGAIKQFITLINYRKLGYRSYSLYFKLREMSESERDRMISRIEKISRVVDIVLVHGTYDLNVNFLVKTTEEASEVLWGLREILEKYALEEKMMIYLKSYFFPRQGLKQKSEDEEGANIRELSGKRETESGVDEIDIRILSALSNNANAPVWKIAKKAKVTGQTAYVRMRKLEKNRVIIGYSAKMDPNLEDLSYYRIFVKLHYIPEKKRKELTEYLHQHPEIYRLIYTFGDYDLQFDTRVKDDTELRRILRDVDQYFSKEVIRQDWVRVYDILKFSFFPNKIEKE